MLRREKSKYRRKILLLSIFAAAMGYFESTVVIYLRDMVYPEGFAFPLRLMPERLITIEVVREASTILMLLAVAALSARKFWERFGYFIFLFGVWDIAFYVWLKLATGWPSSLLTWDILFLIPVPWIGPVIAPLLVSLIMIAGGIYVSSLVYKGYNFRVPWLSWILAVSGITAILYSFIRDSDATLRQQMPNPYLYWCWALGLGLLLAALYVTSRRMKKVRS